MEITLYKNLSSINTVDKILDNNIKATYTASYLKFPTDVLNPTIRIVDTVDDFMQYNYAKIKELNRYYFIENITIFNNDTVDIYLNVDVLMSYYSNILGLTCPVARNEFTYVENIIDDKCVFAHNVKVDYLSITNLIFPLDCVQFSRSPDYNIKLTWLTDATGIGLVGSFLPLPQTCNDIGIFNKELVPNEVASASVLLTQQQAKDLLTDIYNSSTSRSYIKSLTALPIKFTPNVDIIDTNNGIIRINGSNKTVTGSVYKSKYNVIKVQGCRFVFDTCIASSTNTNPFEWQKKSPFTKYELYVPFLGYIELNYDECKGQTLDLVYFVHLESDNQTAVIYRESDGKVLYESEVQIGYKIGVSATNVYENNRLRDAYNATLATRSIVGGITTVAGAVITPFNPAMGAMTAIGGLGMISSGISNHVEQTASLFNKAEKVSSSTAENGLCNSLVPFVRVQYMPCELDYANTTWKHLNGLPFNNTQLLSNIKGFTVIDNVELNFGLKQEQKMIKEQFANGIYLPEVTP